MHRLFLVLLAIVTYLALLPSSQGQQAKSVPMTALTPAKPGELLQYVPDDVALVVAAQPARIILSKGLQGLIEAAKGEDVLEEIVNKLEAETGFELNEVEEIGLVLDRGELNRLQEFETEAERLNNLRQIGLAMHNFHDAYGNLPDDDGPEGDYKGNLSWRVHILPFLEQQALYSEFHLDEPWDSEHNKTLIERMPDIFKTSGVDDAGKTLLHVLLGEGTPFGGDQAPRFQNVTDGTRNTVMVVSAGPDKADVWTKPGGLEIDTAAPIQAFGKISASFPVLMMDGSIRNLERDAEAQDLLHLIQHADGMEASTFDRSVSGSGTTPGIIVRCSNPIDLNAIKEKFLVSDRDNEFVEVEGRQAQRLNSGMLVVFPNAKTMLIASEETLTAMLRQKTKSGEVRAKFEVLYPAADIAAVADMSLLRDPLKKMTQQLPISGLIQNIDGISASLDLTGDQKSLLNLDITTVSNATALQLNGFASGGYQMLKAQAIGVAARDGSPLAETVVEILTTLMDSVDINAEANHVLLNMPKPENSTKLLKDATPALAEIFKGVRVGREAALEREKLGAIKQIGLAMHNYHDAYNGFPSFDTSRTQQAENKGLSWRVHLLPYIGEAQLYSEFKLEEAWDSEHNKKLIEKMPKLFECEGVAKPGHTSYHVFLGKQTPFGGEQPLAIHDITDGTSNTIMVVQAGADTAEVWTKPSGLKFDPKEPRKSLGKLGDKFIVVMCDGFARFIDSTIDDATLTRLIQHSDGEVIGDF